MKDTVKLQNEQSCFVLLFDCFTDHKSLMHLASS